MLNGKTNKHMDKIVLFAEENNTAAINLYESIGFKQIGFFAYVWGI
jgi:ribosomal protein S18 acetylase RimI-like enzyme